MTLFKSKVGYYPVSFNWRPYIRSPKLLFQKREWVYDASGSIGCAWHNLRLNLIRIFTPWFINRRHLILGFASQNCCRRMRTTLRSATIRTLDETVEYFTLEFKGFRYEVIKEQVIDRETGRPVDAFISTLPLLSCPEYKYEDDFLVRKKQICNGFVLTFKQAERAFEKIARTIPQCHWNTWS